jgi:hypothetical protein
VSETPADDGRPGDGGPADDRAVAPVVPPTQVRIRRAPRFARFVATGAVLGAVIGLALAAVQLPSGPDGASTLVGTGLISTRAVLGYFAVLGGLVGGVAGVGVAVLVDRRTWRRADGPR